MLKIKLLPEDGYLISPDRRCGVSGLFLALGGFVICGVSAEMLRKQFSISTEPGNPAHFFWSLLPFILFFSGILLLGLIWPDLRLNRILSAKKFRWKLFGVSLALAAGFQVLGIAIEWISNSHELVWKGFSCNWWKLLTPLLLLFGIQSLTEEILFRWIALKAALSIWPVAAWGLLSTGALFTALHLANPEALHIGIVNSILVYGSSGVFFAYLCLLTRGLEAGWAFHAINNWFGVLLISNTASGLHSPAIMEITYTVGPWIGILMLTNYTIQAVTFRYIFRKIRL
jgi:membrane protease YdiL (CAAX protease family)